MIDWSAFLYMSIGPIGALLVAAFLLYLNRDLIKPQAKRSDHTPAE